MKSGLSVLEYNKGNLLGSILNFIAWNVRKILNGQSPSYVQINFILDFWHLTYISSYDKGVYVESLFCQANGFQTIEWTLSS